MNEIHQTVKGNAVWDAAPMFYCQVLFADVNVISGNQSSINAHIFTHPGPRLPPFPDWAKGTVSATVIDVLMPPTIQIWQLEGGSHGGPWGTATEVALTRMTAETIHVAVTQVQFLPLCLSPWINSTQVIPEWLYGCHLKALWHIISHSNHKSTFICREPHSACPEKANLPDERDLEDSLLQWFPSCLLPSITLFSSPPGLMFSKIVSSKLPSLSNN